MKRKVLDFSVMKEEISQNNVLEMAELIAFMELRFQIGYLGSRAQKMYSDLYGDIKHKNELGYISLPIFLMKSSKHMRFRAKSRRITIILKVYSQI